MFTAQAGELLPVFTQWVNPNETFKIGYNGKTRTAALNADAEMTVCCIFLRVVSIPIYNKLLI